MNLVIRFFLLTGLTMAILPAALATSDPLGRLFFTPAERQALDQRPTNTPSKPTENLHLNGIVKRSSGKQTIWVNSTVYQDKINQIEGSEVQANIDPTTASITTGSTRTPVKVGQTYDPSNQQARDLYPLQFQRTPKK